MQQPPGGRPVPPVYSTFLTGHYSQETRSVYLRDLRDFAAFCCGEGEIGALEQFLFASGVALAHVAELVGRYREQMVGRGLREGTVLRRLSAIRGLYREACSRGFVGAEHRAIWRRARKKRSRPGC